MNTASPAPEPTGSPRSPNEIDSQVGARIRMRRRMLGFSQELLATQMGVTFQQLQKYERGTNRVSASRLYAAATALCVPVSFFFDGMIDPAIENAATRQVAHLTAMIDTSEGLELLRLFPQLATDDNRRRVLDLIHALVGAELETEA